MTHHMIPGLILSHERLEAIEHRLNLDVAAGQIAGATVAVGRRNGVSYTCSVGFRDVATHDTLQPDAIWRIYSMTKPIVTVAAMILVERGELRLDQTVAERLPEFARLCVAQPNGRTELAERAPLVQDLMRHTAGLAYGYLGDSPATGALRADGLLTEDLPLGESCHGWQPCRWSISPGLFGTTAMPPRC